MCVCVCVCVRERERERILGLNEVLQKLNKPLILSVVNQNSGVQSVLCVSRTQGMKEEGPFKFGSS